MTAEFQLTTGPVPIGNSDVIRSPPKTVGAFASKSAQRYEAIFAELDKKRLGFDFNPSASLAGPFWAAWRGMWGPFYCLLTLDLIAAVVGTKSGLSSGVDTGLLASVAFVAATHAVFAFTSDRLYRRQYYRWRMSSDVPHGTSLKRLLFSLLLAFPVFALTLYRFVSDDPIGLVTDFPAYNSFTNQTTASIDGLVSWMTVKFSTFFDVLTFLLRYGLSSIEVLFVQTPWPVVGLAIVLLAYYRGGPRLAVFCASALAYIGLFGLWQASMATIALVATSVLVCLFIGIPLGLLCAKSDRAQAILDPILDIMQTLPTFVYLIPAIAFFSIGKPPGLIATMIFATPPIIRLTALGLRQVPRETVEAADAFGATPLQSLLKVELPLAIPSIQLGINQTIMMSLSMVVIAAMIGAGGLGQQVIRSLQYLRTGQGFLAGFAIVLVAMVLDRMVRRR